MWQWPIPLINRYLFDPRGMELMRTPVHRFRHPVRHPVQYGRQLEASRTRRAMLRPRALGVLSALLQSGRYLLEARRSALSREQVWERLGSRVGLLLAQPGRVSLN